METIKERVERNIKDIEQLKINIRDCYVNKDKEQTKRTVKSIRAYFILTQNELAVVVNIHPASITRWEQLGNIQLRSIRHIIAYLDSELTFRRGLIL